jgi:hypothetical protein
VVIAAADATPSAADRTNVRRETGSDIRASGGDGLRIVEEDSEHIDMGDTWQSEELGHGIDVLLDGRRVEHGRDAKLNGRAERKMRLCSKALERAIGIVGIRIEPEK